MAIRVLTAKTITREAFSPFGTVIECEGAQSFAINQGTTRRYHALAEMDVSARQGAPILSIFRAGAWRLPIRIKMLERHPLGSQAFVPLNATFPWIVVVAQAERPGPEHCEAFIVGPNQGVQYKRNVWHHPLLVLSGPSDFLVADRCGPGENLEECFFVTDECEIRLPLDAAGQGD